MEKRACDRKVAGSNPWTSRIDLGVESEKQISVCDAKQKIICTIAKKCNLHETERQKDACLAHETGKRHYW